VGNAHHQLHLLNFWQLFQGKSGQAKAQRSRKIAEKVNRDLSLP